MFIQRNLGDGIDSEPQFCVAGEKNDQIMIDR